MNIKWYTAENEWVLIPTMIILTFWKGYFTVSIAWLKWSIEMEFGG